MLAHSAKIALAVQNGLSPVCATCERYWEGRAKNLPDGRCTSTSGCGSPLAGDVFTDYKGPLSEFTRFCFMCPSESEFAIAVPGKRRLIGVCEHHAQRLHEMTPFNISAAAKELASRLVLKTETGREAAPYRIVGRRKKTLREVMWETEQDWKEQADTSKEG